MTSNSNLAGAAIAFTAGFLATVIFHQSVVAALNAFQSMPVAVTPWSLDPVPPFGVPTLISKAFWGGVWGILLYGLLSGFRGAAYWGAWIVLGAVALPLVAIFLVPPLKGQPVPEFSSLFPAYALINAVWGFGAALILRMLGRGG